MPRWLMDLISSIVRANLSGTLTIHFGKGEPKDYEFTRRGKPGDLVI